MREFVVVPDTGYQFSHWSASLASELQICAKPTQATCTVTAVNLLPSLEGFPVNIKAKFRAVTGYSLACVEFSDGEQRIGSLRQMPGGQWVEDGIVQQSLFTFALQGRDASTVTQEGATTWIERATGTDVVLFSFVETGRTATAITLFDEDRNAEVVLSFADELAYFRVLPDGELGAFAAIVDAR